MPSKNMLPQGQNAASPFAPSITGTRILSSQKPAHARRNCEKRRVGQRTGYEREELS